MTVESGPGRPRPSRSLRGRVEDALSSLRAIESSAPADLPRRSLEGAFELGRLVGHLEASAECPGSESA